MRKMNVLIKLIERQMAKFKEFMAHKYGCVTNSFNDDDEEVDFVGVYMSDPIKSVEKLLSYCNIICVH